MDRLQTEKLVPQPQAAVAFGFLIFNDALINGATAGAAPRLSFKGDSDAHIVRGLIAILFAIYSGRCADEIVRIDAEGVFRRLGLAEHLTPQRSNGFASMVERICTDARRVMSREARAA